MNKYPITKKWQTLSSYFEQMAEMSQRKEKPNIAPFANGVLHFMLSVKLQFDVVFVFAGKIVLIF